MLALSSEVEIRSMAGVEAMASGCPVLVSRKSGVVDLFNHTPAMLPVESSVDNWVSALRLFVLDTARQKMMHDAALDLQPATILRVGRSAGGCDLFLPSGSKPQAECKRQRRPKYCSGKRILILVPHPAVGVAAGPAATAAGRRKRGLSLPCSLFLVVLRGGRFGGGGGVFCKGCWRPFRFCSGGEGGFSLILNRFCWGSAGPGFLGKAGRGF